MPIFSIDPRVRALEERCVADVGQYGVHVIKVLPEGDRPEFAYTVGLHRTFDHPELIIFGLPLDTMHRLLNNVAASVSAGRRWTAGDVTGEFLDEYEVTFRAVPRHHYREHLGWASWFNGGSSYATLQLIYPDREGRWPWDAGASEGFRQQQPVLETTLEKGGDGQTGHFASR